MQPQYMTVTGYARVSTENQLRTCIHIRLSKVWKWEILAIASAEETEIS